VAGATAPQLLSRGEDGGRGSCTTAPRERRLVTIPFADPLALTRALVRVDSRNPTLVPGAPGEGPAAALLADVLRAWGARRVELVEVAPGRPNVIARFGTGAGARSLMFNGHLDVVGTDGMTHPPFDAAEEGGLLRGRGSADMKGGIAAMCAAAARAHRAGVPGEIVVAAVIDEEYESLGTRALVASGVRADAAVLPEPTRLALAPAHRGFAWIEAEFRGRAAHGSRYDIGVDAVRHAGLVLAELDALDGDELPRRTPHPLLGRPSVHASTVAGGVGWSTYPERCVLRIERRTLPGETAADALAEVEAACARVRARRPQLDVTLRLETSQLPSDVPVGAPIARAVAQAAEAAAGAAPAVEGLSAWTDAALLNEAGIPAVCYGPGDIALAHAAAEWVPVAEVEQAAAVLTRLATDWCLSR
jgi:acetylornithine deacetylase